MPENFKAIDLFCGAGGSSYGTSKAGVDIVAGFDMWEKAINVYAQNFPLARAIQADLTTLKPQKIQSQIGDVDLIIASPECTNHSKAKRRSQGNQFSFISEKSRETAFAVLRFAEVFKPKWMVLENVVEMQNWKRHAELLRKLREREYFVKEVKLNASDFGVPQSRERLFILCSLTGKAANPVFSGQVNKPVCEIIDTSDRYKFSPLRKKGRAEKTIKSAQRAIAQLGNDTPFLLVYYGSERLDSGGWQRLDKPLRTVTTVDRFAYVTPLRGDEHLMRMLQPEELKLAMGFGTDFKLSTIDGLTRRDMIKLMGNGVCPPVMEAIVKSLTQPV